MFVWITIGMAVLLVWASFIADSITKEWRKQGSVMLDELFRRKRRRR